MIVPLRQLADLGELAGEEKRPQSVGVAGHLPVGLIEYQVGTEEGSIGTVTRRLIPETPGPTGAVLEQEEGFLAA
jgi:hypothetical protein